MKNNNMNMNNSRHIRRNSDRARAITKAKARKTNILLTIAAFGLAAVIGVSVSAFSLFNNQSVKTPAITPTTVAMQANENKAAQNTKQESQTATQAPDDERTAVQTAQDDSSTQTQAAQSDDQQTAQDNSSEDRIDVINGERVYIDTKRPAPEHTGTPATYYANGKTSYGFDWDYDADNGNFVLNGGYNFDQQQYIFTFYGVTPGVSHVTLYYNTDDNTQASVNLTVTVDNDLNVTVG